MHGGDRVDAFLVAVSSISAGSLFIGIIYQQLIPSSLGGLLLSAVLSYYFQRRMHSSIREYEKRKLSVQEALGPIHADLLVTKQVLQYNQENYKLSNLVNQDNWKRIRFGYQYYLIPRDLRQKLDKFFHSVEDFPAGIITRKITEIGKSVCQTLTPNFDLQDIQFQIKDKEGLLRGDAWWWGLVFWKAKPTDAVPGTLQSAIFLDSGGAKFQATQKIIDDFLEGCWKKADQDPMICEARSLHGKFLTEVGGLLDLVERQITEWAD